MSSEDERPTVLLADDDAGILRAFERLLTPACRVVGTVANVDALLEAATRLQPDVIVVDVFIRPGDGLRACSQLREAVPRTKIIVVTAADDQMTREKALGVGASAFIFKPDAAENLVDAILRETMGV
jgi:DNA-binding NarL/FixJ family response regulator